MTINAAEYQILPALTSSFLEKLGWFDDQKINFRIWAKDASLFTAHNEMLMMDWLTAPKDSLKNLSSLISMKEEILRRDFTHYVLAGMGGSSLAAKVMQNILAPNSQSRFFIIDTIHPDEITRLMSQLDLEKTLFIISSKSGTTFEPLFLYRYFEQSLREKLVPDIFGHFQAITDPVSELEQESVENGFLFGPFGQPGIGGRFSALSPFGIWPALLMDIDASCLLRHAVDEMQDLAPHALAKENIAALLAAFLSANLEQNVDKLVIHTSSRFFSLGMWLEQLIAESLGKDGKGLVPIIAHENLKETATCCHLYLVDKSEKSLFSKSNTSSYFSISIEDPYHLGAVMFCLEMAVVFLASILKVNPFDQPDVEKSKIKTKEVIQKFKQKESIAVDPKPHSPNLFLTGDVNDFLRDIKESDYCVMLSFLDETSANADSLNNLRSALSNRIKIPVLLQSGPRYLHSTGQLWKGGKNNGHFIIITGPYLQDLFNEHYALNFSDAHKAQAMGDYLVLLSSKRPVLYAHCNNVDLACKELMEIIS